MDTIKRLHVLMEERGLSLYKLTKMSGVGYSTIKTAERRGGQLTVETIEKICRALNISLRDFFTEGDESVSVDMLSDRPLTKEEIAKLREMIVEKYGSKPK